MSDAITTPIPQLDLSNISNQLQLMKQQFEELIKKTGASQQIDQTIKQGGVGPLPPANVSLADIIQTIKQGGVGPLTLPANVNLADINKQLELFVQLATNILPIISVFVPQLKVLIPILPVLTGLLKMGDDIAQAGTDPAKIADALTAHFKDVAQQVQASKPPA